jgi:hypothetical protein
VTLPPRDLLMGALAMNLAGLLALMGFYSLRRRLRERCPPFFICQCPKCGHIFKCEHRPDVPPECPACGRGGAVIKHRGETT